MSNEDTQGLSRSYLEKFLGTASDNPQALILSAYLEEKEKWETKLKIIETYKDAILQRAADLEKVIVKERDALNKIQIDLHNESGVWVWFLRTIGIKTRAERKFHKILVKAQKLTLELKTINSEFINTLSEYDKIADNPPNTSQYELAMIGNTLFKPR